jgi:hypothetical protein
MSISLFLLEFVPRFSTSIAPGTVRRDLTEISTDKVSRAGLVFSSGSYAGFIKRTRRQNSPQSGFTKNKAMGTGWDAQICRDSMFRNRRMAAQAFLFRSAKKAARQILAGGLLPGFQVR